MIYSILSGLFVLFLVLLFAISGQVFEASRTENIKEGTKIVIKGLSILMCLFIYLLWIPLFTLLLQGFLCNEDSQEELVLKNVKCGSLVNNLLTVFSSFLVAIYILFLMSQ